MKHAMLSLDYFALAKEAKALNTSGAAKVIRIALLGGLRDAASGEHHARHRRPK